MSKPCRNCLRLTDQTIAGVPYCSTSCMQERWDHWTAIAKNTTAYWRHQAEESDRHEWCADCQRSYFAHFDACPHCERRANGGASA